MVPVVPVDPVVSSRCLLIVFSASNGVYHPVEQISVEKATYLYSKPDAADETRDA